MSDEKRFFLTEAQLRFEVEKCENCAEKPCLGACPAGCSPMDFIFASRVGLPSDYRRAAAEILTANPLGGICGIVCPDRHCMSGCVYNGLNTPVNIPAVQATIIQKAKELGSMPSFEEAEKNGMAVAVVGAGPAGLAAGVTLARRGYDVTVFEERGEPGGMCLLIPESRLPRGVIRSDIEYLISIGNLSVRTATRVETPADLLDQGFDAVAVCAGLGGPIALGLDNEDCGIPGLTYLEDPDKYPMAGRVAIVGGGATALDCAAVAALKGAERVELIALENLKEMPLTSREREELLQYNIEVAGRTRVIEIKKSRGGIKGLRTINVSLPPGEAFSLGNIADVPGTECDRPDFDHLIVAIGARPVMERDENPAVFSGGDFINGATSVVEAVASGKHVAAAVHSFLSEKPAPAVDDPVRNSERIAGYNPKPVSLRSDFFGREISSPFLLSAAPPTDGIEQMKAAYAAGWAGGIMKTAFDGVPIHIPARYMHVFNALTYGNCDNVSGHSLDRVSREIEELVKLYPDRLTMGSTGGPVTGDDDADRRAWQGNTAKLESAGAMGVEYSLSCPQGGDGTEGDIVSQNAALTARIIDWIMEVSSPDIPKLFKLTGAVTSIIPIMTAIRQVLERYPGKKAGVTLANTFPTMMFRNGSRPAWEEGIVVGMSGDGVTPISYLTIANASGSGVAISGNGGPMDYKAAADFLALGARTVQFCSLVMKYGYGVIDHIEEGVSHMMLDRGIGSMAELIGRALPDPITDFMDLPSKKAISDVNDDLCLSCGNCTRCPYMAIELNEDKHPRTDASRCIGCGFCTMKCFSQALYLRERTEEEAAALREQ
ncbi:MAG: FAD-dependent oxidoreductase [bacterium]|jgi:NADPH-dependent glutamate synthase beta subunit-like oxidoreductase/dihydroorotate dehydrogenase/ferredoxin